MLIRCFDNILTLNKSLVKCNSKNFLVPCRFFRCKTTGKRELIEENGAISIRFAEDIFQFGYALYPRVCGRGLT